MSDHAATVRGWMKKNHYQLNDQLGYSIPTDMSYDTATAALAALEQAEADLDEWADIAPESVRTPGLFRMYVDALEVAKDAAEAALAIEREGNPNRVICPKCQANLPCESCKRYSVLRDSLEAERDDAVAAALFAYRIGTEEPPDDVVRFFQRLHDIPEVGSSAARAEAAEAELASVRHEAVKINGMLVGARRIIEEREQELAKAKRERDLAVAERDKLREALTERGMTESWRPDWTSAPGDTLRELIEMRGWTQAHLAREIGWSLKHVNRVVKGHETISVDFAMALESLDFGSAEFWMRREGDYRVGIARASLKRDTP